MGSLLEKLLNPLLSKLDGWKTILGLLGLLVIYLIRQIKPDLLDADTANMLYVTFSGLSGFGIIQKDTKRIVNETKRTP